MNAPQTDYLVKSLMLAKPPDAMDQLVAHAENLEKQLYIAAGLLSTYPTFDKDHPEKVLEMLKLEAAR